MAQWINKSPEKGKNELSFRDILEFAPIGILVFQKDWRIIYVNKNFFHFKGTIDSNPETLIGKSVLEVPIIKDTDVSIQIQSLQFGEGFEITTSSYKRLKGEVISLILKGMPINVNSEFAGGILIIEDVKTSSDSEIQELLIQENLGNIASNLADLFIITDTTGEIKYKPENTPLELELFLEPPQDKMQSLSPKITNRQILELINESNEKSASIEKEISVTKGFKEKIFKVISVPYNFLTGKTNLFSLLINDITDERKRDIETELELKELRRYQQIISTLINAVIGLDDNGNIVFWNEAAYKLFGLTKSEVYGKFIGKIFSTITKPYFEILKQELNNNPLWEGQFKIGENESTARYLLVRMAYINQNKEKLIMILCTDITERAQIEKELRQSEEKFRNIVTNSHEFICTLELDGKINYVNPYFKAVFQYTEEEIYKLNFTDLIDSQYLLSNNFKISELENTTNKSFELPLITKDGQKITVLASFAVVYDLNGIPLYYNALLTDITLQKDAEKDLLLTRSIFEASRDGIALIANKKFILANDSFVEMFGYSTTSEVLNKDPLDFVADEDIVKVANEIKKAEDGREISPEFEFLGKKRNNDTFDVKVSVSLYNVGSEAFIVWVVRNITEEKKSRVALEISEERYRSITENINESFWTAEKIDGKMKVVLYTSAIQKITGYSSESFIKNPDLWHQIIHPDDVEEVIRKMKKFYNDSARKFESFEYRILDTLGNIVWIENKINVIRDKDGKPKKIFGVVTDITMSKRAEENLKKSARELKELNETKDRFISIISHDLRTPFSSILGYTDILLTESDLDEARKRKYIEFIQQSSKSMLALVNSLLDWTRLQTGRIKFEPERINATAIVNNVFEILSGAALQKNIELKSELNKDLYVHADINLLLQVFNNLISNAIKFSNRDSTITVGGELIASERKVKFYVKDEGVGIKKEDLPKLFKIDTKFTTPGTAGEKGSGLGLSLVHDIVLKHGGEIWVESELNKGSTFFFTIPISSTNILLVDDAKTDRLLYSKLFKSLFPEFSIIEASNGKEALEMIKQTSPALVITDHKMPIMTGFDLVKQIAISDLKVKPPIIILSSDINSEVEADYKELGVDYVFKKPVNLTQFKLAVESSLKKVIFS
ncbi:PAS domain S-box protein [Melioribacteraceae bacterium 4301-Me]|uniref:PAS domain S-box protein n=1 Tax=Pyranulibacter aquaticus TaxID=3163344 RepID=UPI00359B2CB9